MLCSGVRLTLLGAARQVTGSCYALETSGAGNTGGSRFFVDCGLYQERALQSRNWEPTPFDVGALHAVVLTHAHLDHSGLLPKLVREGFRGPIYTTPPTAELIRIVLEDSARLQREDVDTKKKRHRKEERKSPHPYRPLYTLDDVKRTLRQVRMLEYGEPVRIGSDVSVVLRDAGHILGSAIVEIEVDAGPRLVFSGDLGQPEVPLVRNPTPLQHADYVIIESTYGARDHEHNTKIEDQLAEAVNTAADAGGNLVIPTFAIDRAQQLLLHLGNLLHAGRIPQLRVFLDSPMAIRVTEIYMRNLEYLDDATREALTQGHLAEDWSWLELSRTRAQSMKINGLPGTQVVLAGSGMCTGGRIKHHLAWNLGRPESILLFAGYQAEGTLGRLLLEGARSVRLFGREHDVRASVRQIQGLSAHAGRDDLLGWLGGLETSPRRIIVSHGSESAALALAERVRSDFGYEVEVPRYREPLELG